MPVISHLTQFFRQELKNLPSEVQNLAAKNYELWKNDPRHPSIHFKPLRGGKYWSARVGIQYRAVGYWRSKEEFVWIWIGSHADYDRLIDQLR